MIKDDELITPTESYILMAMLDKLITNTDMSSMEIQGKAIELRDLINNE